MAPDVAAYFTEQHAGQWAPPTEVDRTPGRVAPPMPVPQSPPRAAPSDTPPATATTLGHDEATPLVEFRGVTVAYPPNVVVLDRLEWAIRPGEKWAVVGGNGSGKSTVVELITGTNLQGYQQPIHLFGRRKGTGESIWSIRAKLGLLSTEFHMEYVDFADPSVRGAGMNRPDGVSTWEVVCSGFFDSVGLYKPTSPAQVVAAHAWINRLGLCDLVTQPPPPPKHGPQRRVMMPPGKDQNFFHLSHGQQKLVLLCRAVVKRPQLLLLDEPTHGLSGSNRRRMLHVLKLLADDPGVALLYVTHRQDEIDQIGFPNQLRLDA